MHLDYYAVRRRLAAASTAALTTAEPQQIVELDLRADANAPSTSRQQQCRLKIRDGDGGTLHIDLSGW